MLLSEKANQLGHDSIGIRGRRLTSVLLVLSALLGYLAGVTGLTDLVGKTAVARPRHCGRDYHDRRHPRAYDAEIR